MLIITVRFKQGLKCNKDRAIIQRGRKELTTSELRARKIDELPFDFEEKKIKCLSR